MSEPTQSKRIRVIIDAVVYECIAECKTQCATDRATQCTTEGGTEHAAEHATQCDTEFTSGQTLAALMLNNNLSMRVSVTGEPRAGLCAMGYCGECRVKVSGAGVVLACMLPCADGMVVSRYE